MTSAAERNKCIWLLILRTPRCVAFWIEFRGVCENRFIALGNQRRDDAPCACRDVVACNVDVLLHSSQKHEKRWMQSKRFFHRPLGLVRLTERLVCHRLII